MKTFDIKIEYADKYSDAEVLYNILENIDINILKNLGIRFSVDDDLKERYNKFIEKRCGIE